MGARAAGGQAASAGQATGLGTPARGLGKGAGAARRSGLRRGRRDPHASRQRDAPQRPARRATPRGRRLERNRISAPGGARRPRTFPGAPVTLRPTVLLKQLRRQRADPFVLCVDGFLDLLDLLFSGWRKFFEFFSRFWLICAIVVISVTNLKVIFVVLQTMTILCVFFKVGQTNFKEHTQNETYDL